MTSPTDVLKIAAANLGYKEFPANSNHNKFGVWYGLDFQPWCAIFVSYCFYNAGLPLNISSPKGFCYCPFGVQWFRQMRRFDLHPKPGTIVFYDWNRDGIADHVGIVEKVKSESVIVAIEGNTSVGNDSNGGQVMRRERSLSTILGFGHPNYSNESTLTALPADHPKWMGRLVTLTSPSTSGKDVEVWHTQMKKRGWRTEPDPFGTFGLRSYDVLLAFQREKGLECDGVLGPRSWNAAWELPTV